ncbi:hypothetical protein GALMADRAFT_255506 [Galerina marginata CBS 339.88]|uniref:Uncharacterized protein n=1 Tax=Galerina marginata (strain CBS 339.88) TaxID=685588 RepID=A0A067SPT5_GALM3|nr:hypothetical protein GALMADRAFT_255506 [Galerina marginata CBS 339.88]
MQPSIRAIQPYPSPRGNYHMSSIQSHCVTLILSCNLPQIYAVCSSQLAQRHLLSGSFSLQILLYCGTADARGKNGDEQ